MTVGKERTNEEVIQALHGVASEMHDKMVKGKPPTMTLPVRTKSNIDFDENLGVFKYGKEKVNPETGRKTWEIKKTVRDATNLGSAKQLLRSLYIT